MTSPRPWFLLDHAAAHGDACDEAEAAARELASWLRTNVVGHDVLPARLPEDLGDLINRLATAQQRQRRVVANPADDAVGLLLRVARSEPLTREEFYLVKALDLFHDDSDPEYEAYLTRRAPTR